MQPVFRFAPSPNGALHLGHALSALINYEAAQHTGGHFLLRIEDIDTVRCTKENIEQMQQDLHWLGLEWDQPAIQQSDRFAFYETALETLIARDLVYPSVATRKNIQTAIKHWERSNNKNWPRDPDGAPHFPRALLSELETEKGEPAWRLDMQKALQAHPEALHWTELTATAQQPTQIPAHPSAWGDVVLARKDCHTSYHLSVVLDDADQQISHVVRGLDLYQATSLHRLLQEIFDLPAPLYHHHRLLSDVDGMKLSKSRGDLSLKSLRDAGKTPSEIRRMIAWTEQDFAALVKD